MYVSEFFSKIPQAVGESVEKRKSYQKLFLFCFQSRLGFFLSFCFKTEDCFFFNYIPDDLLFFKLQPTLFFFWGKWTGAKPSGMVLCCLYKTLLKKKQTKRLTSETRQWFFFSNKKKLNTKKVHQTIYKSSAYEHTAKLKLGDEIKKHQLAIIHEIVKKKCLIVFWGKPLVLFF